MDQQPEKPEPIWQRAVRKQAQQAWEVAKAQAAKVDWKKLRWRRILAYVAAVGAGIVVLIAATGIGLNTDPGKRFLLGLINGFATDTGLKVHIGALEGSIYGDLTLRDIQVSDPKGVFLTSPRVHLNWRPLAYVRKHVDIRDLSTPRIDVLRLPQLNPGKPQPQGSLLPDLAIDINRVRADFISLHAGVAGGDARNLNFSGVVHILHKRAQITATAFSDRNDQLGLRLDARPDDNRLDLDAHLNAPQDGVVVTLLGLGRPLRADLDGKGSWKQWDGKLKANLANDSLADLALTARGGRFTVKGPTRPDLILSGESADILKPNVRVDFDGALAKRRLDVALALASDVATVKAQGLLDLAYSRFGHVEVHANLLKPERLDKTFTASDLHADLRVDGAFVTPRIDYDIDATRFGFGGLKVAGLHAEGKSHFDQNELKVPLHAEWASLSGIDARVDPLLTHLTLNGDLTLDHSQLSSDNLRLKTDRVQASADLQADLSRGMFASNVKAGLKGYRLDQIGTADLGTSVKVARTKTGQLTLAGNFTARSTQWENDGVAKFLGGNAKLAGNYGLAPGGKVFVGKMTGQAPDFTLLSGDGTFGPKGALLFKATAQSKQYGPLELAVTGTADKPQAELKATSPGLGMQIKDVVADLAPATDGYAVKVTGGSAYGPFSADTLLVTAKGPLAVDIHQGQFAGVGLAGRLTQTEAGPFAGTLSLNGSGLTGTAHLDSLNGDQAAAINAIGNHVELPGDLNVHVGRAIITANAVLRKEIQVDADVQMADLTYQTFSLATGRAKVMLRGENGTVQAVAHGRKDIPFDLAVNAKIAPNLYTVAAQGKANDIDFHLDHPARIEQRDGIWVLTPVALVTPSGRMDLAGTFGNGYKVQARLDGVDLGLIDAFQADAGVTGKMDGAIDFTQSGDAYPTARANLKISRFSRASAAVASTPVDLAIDAALTPGQGESGNYVRALVRRGSIIVGRVQMNLTPAAPGPESKNGWTKQITNAGVTGGIRYNGPAGVLFSLAGQPRQQLDGPIAVAADFSGQLNAPHLNGLIKANSLTYDNEDLGTRITAVSLDGRFSNDKLELTKFHGTAGQGEVGGTGWVSLAASDKFPLQVHVDLHNACLARSDSVDSTVSGSIDLSNDATNGAVIKGDLRLPELRYVVTHQGAAEINELEGVHHKGYSQVAAAQTGLAAPALWKLDIRVRADNQIFVSGMGLESEWRMNLHVGGTTRDPRVDGEMDKVRGYYQFAGRDFNIDEGTIRFNGGALMDPEIDITASGTVKDVNGIIRVTGSAQRPDIAFSSTPALPQDEVLSRMLFGESVTNLSATEALQLASAVNGLRGGKDYLNPLGALRQATGIDRLRVVGADTATGRGTSLAAGKYLTNSVYVEIVTDSKGFTGTQIEIALSRALSLLSSTGGTAGTSVGLRYSKDY
ncbi:MAG TPA: translocation/assembly module TamB domain-containing protein [Asticcacaulis sp.]|nr:translocation/assembly module TamB domain-containing protein [Asticcacaulis sp.]